MYKVLYAKDLENKLVGYVIVNEIAPEKIKLDGSNLYTVDEGREAVDRVNELNMAALIKAVWPNESDEDVQKLLNDSTFEPNGVNYQGQVPDPETSTIVTYLDADGYEQIDWENSDIQYKEIEVKSPVSTRERIHKASEVIARRRAGLS